MSGRPASANAVLTAFQLRATSDRVAESLALAGSLRPLPDNRSLATSSARWRMCVDSPRSPSPVDGVGFSRLRYSSDDAWRCIGRDIHRTKMLREAQFIGMEAEDISMLEGELFPAEILNGFEHFLGSSAGWHGEHQLMNQPGRWLAESGIETRFPAILVQIEIPVLQEFIPDVGALQCSAVIGLHFEIAFAANVVDVLTHGRQAGRPRSEAP